MRYAKVAVDMSFRQKLKLLSPSPRGDWDADPPLLKTFHYEIPPALGADIALGQLVWVPFGKQQAQGIVVGFDTVAPVPQLRQIAKAVADIPPLTPVQIELARWLSLYYLAPLFDALSLMLPLGVARQARDSGGAGGIGGFAGASPGGREGGLGGIGGRWAAAAERGQRATWPGDHRPDAEEGLAGATGRTAAVAHTPQGGRVCPFGNASGRGQGASGRIAARAQAERGDRSPTDARRAARVGRIARGDGLFGSDDQAASGARVDCPGGTERLARPVGGQGVRADRPAALYRGTGTRSGRSSLGRWPPTSRTSFCCTASPAAARPRSICVR